MTQEEFLIELHRSWAEDVSQFATPWEPPGFLPISWPAPGKNELTLRTHFFFLAPGFGHTGKGQN